MLPRPTNARCGIDGGDVGNCGEGSDEDDDDDDDEEEPEVTGS